MPGPNDDPMVGMAEGADCARVEVERSDSVGCHGDAQQRSRENGLGGVVGGGGVLNMTWRRPSKEGS